MKKFFIFCMILLSNCTIQPAESSIQTALAKIESVRQQQIVEVTKIVEVTAEPTYSSKFYSEADPFSCSKGCYDPKVDCRIKARRYSSGEMLYWVPGSKQYNEIKLKPRLYHGDFWFCTEEEAKSNGYWKFNE